MARNFVHFFVILGHVGQHHLERLEHTHGSRRIVFQIRAYGVIEHGNVDQASVSACDTDHLAELADRGRCVTPPPHAGEGRHTWIIPAIDDAFIHQQFQLALGGDGVVQVEPCELDLPRLAGNREVVEEPLVERPMIFKLKGANRVGDAFNGIRLTMCEIIGRVDFPGIAGLMVMRMANTIQDRITQIDVGRGHIDLRPQYPFPFVEFTGAHALKQIKVLFNTTLAPGAVPARLG